MSLLFASRIKDDRSGDGEDIGSQPSTTLAQELDALQGSYGEVQ
jgi:hypothetical protein